MPNSIFFFFSFIKLTKGEDKYLVCLDPIKTELYHADTFYLTRESDRLRLGYDIPNINLTN